MPLWGINDTGKAPLTRITLARQVTLAGPLLRRIMGLARSAAEQPSARLVGVSRSQPAANPCVALGLEPVCVVRLWAEGVPFPMSPPAATAPTMTSRASVA